MKPTICQPTTELTGPRLLAPATCYAAWRSSAETRLAHLNRCRWSHEQAIRELDREIKTLEETMGNGASGGTAWMRHNTEVRHAAPDARNTTDGQCGVA